MRYNLILLSIIILLASCTNEALEYNNKITEIEDIIIATSEKSDKKISQYYETGEWAKLAREAKKVEDKIKEKISELEEDAAPDLDEGENFKEASISYFTYYKNAYKGYRKIGEAETDEDRLIEQAALNALVTSRDDVLKKLRSAQKKFATANNLKMESESDEEDKPKKKKTEE